MENIIACIRIKPVSKEEEVSFSQVSDKVVTNHIEQKNSEFGTIIFSA